MAGLFTLDSATLGVLGEDVLGGQGTGFVIGTETSAGSVIGIRGVSGSATGSSTSAGSVTGSEGAFGSASGTQSSQGSATGSEGAAGSVTGATSSTCTVAGATGFHGSVIATSSSTGSASGSPGLSGTANGTQTSSGSVTGTGPTPPTPPPPVEQPTGHGPRLFYPDPPRPKPIPLPMPEFIGAARGRQRSQGVARGTVTLFAVIRATQATEARVIGVRWPDDFEIARRARVRRDDELLMLELV